MPPFSLLARGLRSLFGLGHPMAAIHQGSPRFNIRDVAVATHEGSSTKYQLLIEETGGDCCNVCVILGSRCVKAFGSFRAGQSRKVTLTFDESDMQLVVRIIGFDANGSFCQRTFRGASVGSGIAFS